MCNRDRSAGAQTPPENRAAVGRVRSPRRPGKDFLRSRFQAEFPKPRGGYLRERDCLLNRTRVRAVVSHQDHQPPHDIAVRSWDRSQSSISSLS